MATTAVELLVYQSWGYHGFWRGVAALCSSLRS